MESVFRNGLYYTIEFIKMLLVAQYIFRLEPKKRISYAYGASLAVVMLAAYWFDFDRMHYTEVFIVLEILVLFLFTKGKRRFVYLLLGMLMITIADLFIVTLISLFVTDFYNRIDNSPFAVPLINSISLILFVFVLIIYRNKRREKIKISKAALPIYLLSAFAIMYSMAAYVIFYSGRSISLELQRVLIICQVIIVFFFFYILIVLNKHQIENERLRMQIEKNREIMQLQNSYYIKLSVKDEDTRRFRHDLRTHILGMRQLCKEGDYSELEDYLEQLEKVWSDLSIPFQSGNVIVNAILSDLTQQYPYVKLRWNGKLNLDIPQMDVSTIFYNLMKNAYEAASQTDHPWVEVYVRTQGESIIIEQRNPYREILQNGDGFPTTKQGEGHGYGLINLRECVKKNRGSYHADAQNGVFRTEIIFLK